MVGSIVSIALVMNGLAVSVVYLILRFLSEFEPSVDSIATVMMGVVVLLSQNGVDKPGSYASIVSHCHGYARSANSNSR
jgi:hypothetical protein